MNITESQVTKILITGIDNLDPVSVYLEQSGNQAKVTVECFGDAGSAVFSTPRDIVTFLSECNADYLARKFANGDVSTLDFEAISEKTGECVSSEYECALVEESLMQFYGEDWRHELPYTNSTTFNHFLKISQAVIDCMKTKIS